MIEEIIEDLKESIKKSLESLKRALMRLRTGRAHLGILDGIKVEYYGTLSPLNHVAGLAVTDPRLISIKPWDKKLIPVIEKAILQSNLGLYPQSNGDFIRLPIPPLTQERRKQLIKMIKKQGEESKISIRNARREANELLRSLEKEGEISQDEMHRSFSKIQEIVDEAITQVQEIIQRKEKDILED
jgi:ribosome recycling factor